MVKARPLLTAWLEGCPHTHVLHLSHSIYMVVGNIFHALRKGKARPVRYPRIVVDFPAVHMEGQEEEPLLCQKLRVKGKAHGLLGLIHTLLGELPGTVQGVHLIVQGLDPRVVGLDVQLQGLVCHRGDAVPHGSHIHLPHIAGQIIHLISLTGKGHRGQGRCPQVRSHIVVSSVCHIAEHDDRRDEDGGQYARVYQASLHLSVPRSASDLVSNSLPSVGRTCSASSHACSFFSLLPFLPVFTARISIFFGVCSMSMNSSIWVS